MVHHLTDNWGRNVSPDGIAVKQASVLSFCPLEPEWRLVAPSLICGVPAARPQSLEISRVKLRVHTILGDIRHPIRPLGPHPSGVIPADPPPPLARPRSLVVRSLARHGDATSCAEEGNRHGRWVLSAHFATMLERFDFARFSVG